MGRFAGGGETKRKVAPHKLFQHGVQELVHMTRFLISAAVGAIDVVATVMRRPPSVSHRLQAQQGDWGSIYVRSTADASASTLRTATQSR